MDSVPSLAAHWIDGRPFEGAPAFDVAAAGGRGDLRRYPRAATEELARALEAALRGGPAWAARPPRERARLLERAAEHLGAPDDEALALWRALAARIGFDERELERVRAQAAQAAQAAAEQARSSGPDGARGPLMLVPHWSELVEGAARRAFGALAGGAPVVLVSDARAPMVVELVAQALVRAELDAGSVALLHDDVDRVARAFQAERHAGTGLVVSAPRAELARRFPALRAEPRDEPPHEDTDERRAPAAPAPFGAGLGLEHDVARQPSSRARRGPVPLVSGTLVVGDDEDLDEAARRVVDAALSRLPALSGQRPGLAGRVLVPERRLSRFTEALLEHLESVSDLARPLPPIDREEVRERRRARALGVDEGATLIWSGAPLTADTAGEIAVDGPEAPPDGGGRERAEAVPSSRAEDGRASLLASVFTNVEPGGRLCDLSRPLPLVRLVRVGDEAAGRRLAEALGRAAAPATTPAQRPTRDPEPRGTP